MKLTAIEQLAHKPGLYRISVDNKPLGYVTAENILGMGLTRGSEVDQTGYTKLVRMVKRTAFYTAALNYADRRLRSKTELKSYLKRKGCDEQTANEIIDKLVELGVVDESKLAAAYVHDAELLKPLSRSMLKAKLQQKRLDPALIDTSLEEAEYDDAAALDKLISLKQDRYKDNKARFFRYLMRQGFSYSEIASRIGRPPRS